MKSSHTPGPWVFINDPCGLPTALELIVDPESPNSGDDSILYHGADWPMNEADIKLISAAPDMLEILVKLMNTSGLHPDLEQKIQDVVRKATT